MKNKPYPLYSPPEIIDLKEMVNNHAQKNANKTIFSFSAGRDNIINKTYNDVYNDINALGTYIYSNNLKNTHIAIIGENCYEWIISFLAIVNGGNIAIPIDKELSPDKIKQLLEQSDCKAVIVSKKAVKNLVSTDIITFSMNDFPQFICEGQELINNGISEYTDYVVNPDKLAAIFFTSGTTGNNKGVMLSHKNMASDINSASKNYSPNGNNLSVLPFHHTFGLMTSVLMGFNYNCPTYINNSLKNLQKDLKLVQPQTMLVVPLFIETFYKIIIDNAKRTGKTKKMNLAIKISNFLLKFGIDFRKKIFKDVLQAFGGNLEYVICGGAPLDQKYVKTFRSWGINILNGYGITECSPVVSVNRNHHWCDGSAGLVIDGCEVKISEDKEILVKGNNIMIGYYNDEIATKQVLDNGWYSTGDLGYIDENGFLFITGRKKNLIILSNGENVSPEELEAKILLDEAVSEAVVYGENGMIVVQIFPMEEYLENTEYFDELIANINKNQPPYMRINKIILRKYEFQKNSAKKILRHKITEENYV